MALPQCISSFPCYQTLRFLIFLVMHKIAVNIIFLNQWYISWNIFLIKQFQMQIALDLVKLWSRKDCTRLHSHRAQDCPFYRIWLTLSAGIYFSLCVNGILLLIEWSYLCSARMNPFPHTVGHSANSLLWELSVPAAWQLNFLLNFCSSPEDHKALYNFIPLHWVFSDGWLLLRVSDSKNVISIWFWQRKTICSVECCPDRFPKPSLK